ncbi:ankyrin repeat domain-containing protein 45-like [Apostichopus japonicus]|uniref:ankyrin repeat domain-containing protein 45-like n=1 Tax=Stichopus japonicus TaxID=307972 RepID=UPI003AB6A748
MVDDNITETGDSQASSPVSRKSGKRINIVIESAFNGDLNKLQECFTNEDNPYHERLQEQINSIDEDGRSPVEIAATEGHVEMMKFLIEKGSEQDTRNPLTGKSPLDMACILGREDIVRELLANEVKYDATSVSGYTALHHASVWDQRKCIKQLIDLDADLGAKTKNGERPRDIAVRYNHTECAGFLDLSEARKDLKNLITEIKEIIDDPQKLQGRLAKDEKMIAVNACADKQEWLDTNNSASIKEVHRQFKELTGILEPIQAKLAEPPPEKPQRK